MLLGYLFFKLSRSLSFVSIRVKSPLTPTSEDTNSSLNPFITDITVIRIDIPRIKAIEDRIVEVEKALSFFELKI